MIQDIQVVHMMGEDATPAQQVVAQLFYAANGGYKNETLGDLLCRA